MDEAQKIRNHLESVGHDLDSWEGVSALVCHNLTNFSYRYISTEHDPTPIPEQIAPLVFACTTLEENLMVGLKLGGDILKQDLIEMAKRVGKEASIAQRISVEILNYQPRSPIDCVVRAQISWEHHAHSFKQNFKEKVIKVHFEEVLELRNRLALALEETCAFF